MAASTGSPSAAPLAREAIADARTLLADPNADAHDVGPLLRRVWAIIFGTVHQHAGDAPASDADVAPWARDRLRRRFGDLDGDESRPLRWIFAGEGEGAPPAEPSREELGAHVDLLDALLREDVARHDGAPLAGLLLVAALVAVGILAPLLPSFGVGAGPWRGRYYDNTGFAGDSIEEDAHRIDFDFGRGAPRPGMPADGFSIRWDTCLVLEDETKLRFTATSDDGSRVIIDDEVVVDNWGDHAKRARSGAITLEAGTYHLVVEYYDERYGASIEVTVALGGAKAGPIPEDMLRSPSDDEDDPCG
jgi:hypothetical protein